MSGPILVTGAGGNVGGAVARSLAAAGAPVRAADLRPDRLHGQLGVGVPVVRLDFEDPATFAAALDGAGGLFLVRPPRVARVGPTLNVLVDAAIQAGVGHVVFSSVAGAERNVVLPHHRVERHLQAATTDWTILRPGFFAQNLAGPYRDDICDDDRLYVPAGDGRVAFLDTRDLGDAAAAVFAAPDRHRQRGYTLTGSEAVTMDEVAAILTRHLGRTIRYEPATVAGYVRHLRRQRGLRCLQVTVQTLLHVGLRRGDAATVEPDSEQLLGRRPRTIEEFVRDHVELWQRSTSDHR